MDKSITTKYVSPLCEIESEEIITAIICASNVGTNEGLEEENFTF